MGLTTRTSFLTIILNRKHPYQKLLLDNPHKKRNRSSKSGLKFEVVLIKRTLFPLCGLVGSTCHVRMMRVGIFFGVARCGCKFIEGVGFLGEWVDFVTAA